MRSFPPMASTFDLKSSSSAAATSAIWHDSFMVSALTHRYRPDAADEFISSMRALVGRLRSSLREAGTTAAVLVTRTEAIVVEETRRYASALEALHVAVAGTCSG